MSNARRFNGSASMCRPRIPTVPRTPRIAIPDQQRAPEGLILGWIGPPPSGAAALALAFATPWLPEGPAA